MTPAELPKIPAAFFSLLGPLPIVRISDEVSEKDEKFGEFLPSPRLIELSHDNPVTEWSTLWHEATHSALFDAGVNNIVTHEQCEVICDVIGTYLTAMMLAGQLAVHSGKDAVPVK